MSIKYNTKAIVSIPAWAEAMHSGAQGQKDTIGTPAAAYAYVPLVYRAVRLRADALARTPIYFTKLDGETEVEWPFPDVDIRDLLWKTEAALCLQGANYIEKIPRKMTRKTGGLQWINPLTMNARWVKDPETGQMVYEFQQGDKGAKFNLGTMIYMREFSLLGEITANGSVLPGDSPAKTSMNDAALIRYMSRFAARFFETGAMPITVLQIEGIVDADEAKRIEGFFKRAATRIRNAFNVLALSRAVEPKIISQPLKDLAMPELNAQARHAVALAFGIPQTMLEDAANFATSAEHRLSFWSDTVQPRGDWLAEQFNRQLLAEMKIKMRFAFEEMDIFQEDENQRAASLGAIVTAINTNPAAASWAMGVLGYDLTEEQKAELEKLTVKEEPPAAPPQIPAEEPAPAAPITETPAKAAWADDLGRWERKALRVQKESGSPVCAFDSETIPDALRSEIAASLPGCQSADAVRALFGAKSAGSVTTPAPEYKADPGTYELAASINALAEAYAKSLTALPAPTPAEPVIIINNSQKSKKPAPIAQVFAKSAFRKGD
jgi:HK97 family phage portal protein